MISTQLACWMMPFAAAATSAALPGDQGGFRWWYPIVLFISAGWVAILLSVMGVVFVVSLSSVITWHVGGYIFGRISSEYSRLRGHDVPPTEMRGRPRACAGADVLLER